MFASTKKLHTIAAAGCAVAALAAGAMASTGTAVAANHPDTTKRTVVARSTNADVLSPPLQLPGSVSIAKFAQGWELRALEPTRPHRHARTGVARRLTRR